MAARNSYAPLAICTSTLECLSYMFSNMAANEFSHPSLVSDDGGGCLSNVNISKKDVMYSARTSRTLDMSRNSGTRPRSLIRCANRMGSSRRKKDATWSNTNGVASDDDDDDDDEEEEMLLLLLLLLLLFVDPLFCNCRDVDCSFRTLDFCPSINGYESSYVSCPGGGSTPNDRPPTPPASPPPPRLLLTREGAALFVNIASSAISLIFSNNSPRPVFINVINDADVCDLAACLSINACTSGESWGKVEL